MTQYLEINIDMTQVTIPGTEGIVRIDFFAFLP